MGKQCAAVITRCDPKGSRSTEKSAAGCSTVTIASLTPGSGASPHTLFSRLHSLRGQFQIARFHGATRQPPAHNLRHRCSGASLRDF